MVEDPADGEKPVLEDSLNGSLELQTSPGIGKETGGQHSEYPAGRKDAAHQQRGGDDGIVLRPDHPVRRSAEHVGMNQQHSQPDGHTRSPIGVKTEELNAVEFEQEESGRGRQPQTPTDLADVLSACEEGSPR